MGLCLRRGLAEDEDDGGDEDEDDDGDEDGDAEAALSRRLKLMAIIMRKEVATEDGSEHPRELSVVSAGEQS